LIDAGFSGADRAPALQYLFARTTTGQSQIEAVRDFVTPSHTAFYTATTSDVDDHGTEVLGFLAGQGRGIEIPQMGAATGARFLLARTDNAPREYRAEEDYWLAAAEWMDSLGVQVINSSLGYGLGFTNPAENHDPSELNGATSVVSKAAQIAATEKGILVIISAGNDGNNPTWKTLINFPADAPDVLAIAASQGDPWLKAGYSGTGPEELSYLKPDLAAYSLLGTSYSAPIIAGVAICLMEAYPGLKPARYLAALRKAGHLAQSPNNFIGNGVLSASTAHALLGDSTLVPTTVRYFPMEAKGTNKIDVPIPAGCKGAPAIFHKKTRRNVLRQSYLAVVPTSTVPVTQPNSSCRFTTLAWPTAIVEVEWK
jgi:subtilisin